MKLLILKNKFGAVVIALLCSTMLCACSNSINQNHTPAQMVPFSILADEARLQKTSNHTNDPNQNDYLVSIYINHKGARPNWWGKKIYKINSPELPSTAFSDDGLKMKGLSNIRFVSPKRSVRPGASGTWFNLYDIKTNRYMVIYYIHLSKGITISNTRFQATLLTASKPLHIDIPVKAI